MTAPNQHESEAQFEKFLGNLLRAGVFLASAVVLFGGVLYLVHHGGDRPDYTVFHDKAESWTPREITANLAHRSGRAVIQVGLLLLIATPVARVVFSVVGFFRQRDFIYVVLTLIVLAVLLYSLFFGGVL